MKECRLKVAILFHGGCHLAFNCAKICVVAVAGYKMMSQKGQRIVPNTVLRAGFPTDNVSACCAVIKHKQTPRQTGAHRNVRVDIRLRQHPKRFSDESSGGWHIVLLSDTTQFSIFNRQ